MDGRGKRLSIMANENTARRNIYLPPATDQWFVNESEESGTKINALMLEALNEYIEKRSKSNRKKKIDFEKNVRDIALELLKEKGLV